MRDAAAPSSPADHDCLAGLSLPGGPLVRFRHARPDDQSRLADAFRTASRETLLHRFFSPLRRVPPDVLRRMLDFDRSREACILGVIAGGPGHGRIICGARYVRLTAPGAAEIALTVHDDFQRRGLGAFLLRLLARLARADGLRVFEAEVMADNHKMLGLLRKLAPARAAAARWTGDNYHLTLDVQALARSESIS